MPPRKKTKGSTLATATASYQHPGAKAIVRPEAGAQTRFKKKKPTATYRYDSSLAPEMQWDGQNPAREQGEALLADIEAALVSLAKQPGDAEAMRKARESMSKLKALSRPFLNWAGKAEHLSFDVPTLPLFIHERLSTQAILDSVKSFEASGQMSFDGFFGHPERSLPEQLRMAYEHPNGWQNRMVLGDSLVVMNSLLHYENMGGQVQMIYIDPPYGVKFGSNFQPFVRKRDVSHNDDEALTREPEMVKAYRDTWELGLHSYLTYLRDRLLLARELLTDSGSVFVQISDENLHHVREILEEVFGAKNFCRVITVAKTSGMGSTLLAVSQDYLLWFAKDIDRVKFRQIYLEKTDSDTEDFGMYTKVDDQGRRYRIDNLTGQNNNVATCLFAYEFQGRTYRPTATRQWKTNLEGMNALKAAHRLEASGSGLYYKRYLDDFPVRPITDAWSDTATGGFAEERLYVVQTGLKIVQRCMLMTTDPGDLVLDPTCGSGTTAYLAEQWGRRWITIDTSRVPLALARQRLLTATFKYYELKEPSRGPAGGFVYKEKKNRKGEHVGGIVPHITLGSIANNEPPKYEVLVDRPEEQSGITRVCGPFVFEATIPTASNFEGETPDPVMQASSADFIDRMIEVLRASPVLHLPGGKTVQLSGIRRPAKTLYLSAEAVVRSQAGLETALEDADTANGGLPLQQGEPVALLFGPEHGPVAEVAVLNAWQEATAKGFTHLYVIGFAIEPKARQAIDEYSAMGMPTTYVQATPDILMGDLLKNMRSSQIFSVCGQPDVEVREVRPPEGAAPNQAYYEVNLKGLDVFDPVTMEIDSRTGLDVPAWLLDTDYNGMVFRVCQAFFPRTQAWDNLKRALKADFDESVWAHLAGDISTPFAAGQHKQIAVKVIDDRGNELMVVRKLEEQ